MSEVKLIMSFNEYQKYTERTAPPIDDVLDCLNNYALGLTGESGEFADHVKKVIYQGHDLDAQKQALELGDILWYVARSAHALGYTLNDIAQMNIHKLNKRYPNGFSVTDSVNREDV